MHIVNKQTVIFLGPQGCGKGTQLKLLADYLASMDTRQVLTPAMGNLAREFVARDTYASSLLRDVMAQGRLVEYAVSVPLMGSYLLEHVKGNEHILIDGFPRSIEQVEFLDSAARFDGWESPTVIRIEISDDESLRRLALRHRSDDTPEAIRSRLAWTRQAEEKIKGWFIAHPTYRFVEIEGTGTIEETQAKVRAVLNL
jgi:adenylate kinase